MSREGPRIAKTIVSSFEHRTWSRGKADAQAGPNSGRLLFQWFVPRLGSRARSASRGGAGGGGGGGVGEVGARKIRRPIPFFLKRTGLVWTTDTDGMVMGPASPAEILGAPARAPQAILCSPPTPRPELGVALLRAGSTLGPGDPSPKERTGRPPSGRNSSKRGQPVPGRPRQRDFDPGRRVTKQVPLRRHPFESEAGWFAARPSGHRRPSKDLRRKFPRDPETILKGDSAKDSHRPHREGRL